MSTRILVVDDHAVVRRGLAALLSDEPGLCVVGEAASGEAAIALLAERAPEVVIMDVRMPGMGGIEACRRILAASPQTAVVFLTSFPDEEVLVEALLAGARGYVLKNLAESNLIDVVRKVAQGQSMIDPSLGASVAQALKRLSSGNPKPSIDGPQGLTELERALLRCIAEGKTNQEIAGELNFAEKTIRNYVSNLLAKLQLHNRAEAAAYAVRCHLVDDR